MDVLVEVVGDDLTVGGLRLSLIVPFPTVEAFLALTDRAAAGEVGWLDEVREVHALMPATAREQLDGCPDGSLVIKATREWQRALGERLGKSLTFSERGEATPGS